MLGQLLPFLQIDERVQHGASFPEARVVVELRDLVEAKLLVVVRADPLGRINRAFLERGIDVGAADELRHNAELCKHQPGHAADAHLHALQVGDGLDLFAEPAAHLAAGVARENRLHPVLFHERLQRLLTAAVIPPGIRLPRVRAEAYGAGKRERRILAEVVVERRVAELDGACLHCIEHLQRRHDFAGGEGADLEFAVGELAHAARNEVRAAEERVQALGPACGKAPLDRRLRLRDRRRGDRSGGDACRRLLKEGSPLHAFPSGLVGNERGIVGQLSRAQRAETSIRRARTSSRSEACGSRSR